MLEKFVDAEILHEAEIADFTRHIQLSRHWSVQVFRTIVEVTCLTPILQTNATAVECNKEAVMETFFSIFTNMLQERTFLLDYNARYTISDEFDLFEQSGLAVDPTRKHYVLDALCETSQKMSFAETNMQRGEKEKGNATGVSPMETQGT